MNQIIACILSPTDYEQESGFNCAQKINRDDKKNKDNTWLKHSYNDLFLLGKFEIWKNTECKLCLFFILDSRESFGLSSTSSIDLQQPGWFCWRELE